MRGVRRYLHPSVKCPTLNIRLLLSCIKNYNYFKNILQGLFIQPLLFPLLLFLLVSLFPKTITCSYLIAIIKKISIWHHHIYNLFNFRVVNTVIVIIPIFTISFTINFSFFVFLFFITFFLFVHHFYLCVCVRVRVCVL